MEKISIDDIQKFCDGRGWDNLIRIFTSKEISNMGVDPISLNENEVVCEVFIPDIGFIVVKCLAVIMNGEIVPDKVVDIL